MNAKDNEPIKGTPPRVKAIEHLGGHVLRVTFRDGFTGQANLAPLLGKGPIFEPWRDVAFFASVRVSECGVPEWDNDLDLSPDALRAWCEAGRFMDSEETDEWIALHSAPQSVGAP